MTLRATEVTISAIRRPVPPLMQARQTIGIDLPLKALVWQNNEGKTWPTTSRCGWRSAMAPKQEPIAFSVP
jgi:hypothetical protein